MNLHHKHIKALAPGMNAFYCFLRPSFHSHPPRQRSFPLTLFYTFQVVFAQHFILSVKDDILYLLVIRSVLPCCAL